MNTIQDLQQEDQQHEPHDELWRRMINTYVGGIGNSEPGLNTKLFHYSRQKLVLIDQIWTWYSLLLTSCNLNLDFTQDPRLEKVLDALEANSEEILNATSPPLYRYVYDNIQPDRLTNGGNDLFDPYGMKVRFFYFLAP